MVTNKIKKETEILKLSFRALFFYIFLILLACKNPKNLGLVPEIVINEKWKPQVINNQEIKNIFIKKLCHDSSCHYFIKSVVVGVDTLIVSNQHCDKKPQKVKSKEKFIVGDKEVHFELLSLDHFYTLRFKFYSEIVKGEVILDLISTNEAKVKELHNIKKFPYYLEVQ